MGGVSAVGTKVGPSRFRRWILRPLLWGLALLAVGLALLPTFLHSEWMRGRVRAVLLERMERVLGSRVEIDELEYSFLPLGVEARGVRVADRDPDREPALEAERVRVEMELPLWRQRRLALRRLEIERPTARIRIDELGHNLPPGRRSPPPQRWQVRIDAVEVEDGVVELEHRRLPLSLQARELRAEMLGIEELTVQGRFEVPVAEVTLPGARPTTVSVQGRLAVGRSGVRVAAARIQGPGMSGSVRGQMSWKPEPRTDLQVSAEAELGLVRGLGYSEAELAGRVRYEGGVSWSREAWGFRGEVEAADLRLEGRRVRSLRGQLAGDRHGVRLQVESALYAGGSLQGRVGVEVAEGTTATKLDLELTGASLEAIAADSQVVLRGVGTGVDISLAYGFLGSDKWKGRGWADLELQGQVREGALELAGEAGFLIHDGQLTSQVIRLEGGGQRILAEGGYSLSSRTGRFDYSVVSDDLGPIARVLSRSLDYGEPGPRWLPESGTGSAEGTLFLTPGATTSDVRLDLKQLLAPGLAAQRLRGSLRVAPGGVEDLRLELGRGPEQALLVTGRASDDSMQVGVDAVEWPLAEAQEWLPFELPIRGDVSGQLRLDGHPDALNGFLRASAAAPELFGVPTDRIEVELDWTPDRVTVRGLRLEVAGGSVRTAGTIELPEGELDLELVASELDPLQSPVAGGRLGGSLSILGRIAGTLAEPTLDARVLGADLRAGDRSLGPGRLEVSWQGGALRADGGVEGLLEVAGGGSWGDEGADLEFELRSKDLEGLLALALPDRPLPISGELQGRLRLEGSSPRVTLELDQVAASFHKHQLRNLEPVVASWGPDGLSIVSLFLGVEGENEVFVAGRIGPEPDPRLDLHLTGRLAAGWLQLWNPDLKVEGRVDFLGGVRGSLSEPRLDGQSELVDGRVVASFLPHAIDNIGGVVLLYPGRVVFDDVTARAAGGDLRLGGVVELGADPEDVSYRLQLQGRGLSPHLAEGWLLRGDADLALVSQENGRELRGTVTLDRAYYLQDVSVDPVQLLVGLLEQQRREVGETDERLASTYLDLHVEAPDTLRIRNNVADLDARGSLNLRGSLARPVVFGRVDVEPGGSMVYSETSYRVERGELSFSNPYRIEPVIELVASTEIREYDVTLSLSGTLNRLRPTFSSNPPLPDLEVLRLLLTRQGPAGGDLAALESEQGGVGAASLLYGQAASLVSERFSSLFGLDELRIQPLSAGTGDFTSATAFTVGKQLTSNVYVTYGYDPSTTEEQHLQVDWSIGAGKMIVLTQNGDGSYAVDLRFEKRY